MLVTGGTVFVSRYIAEHFVAKKYEVYVLNRDTREQSSVVKLIKADRHNIGDLLKKYHFDIVIDTAYTGNDVRLLLDALESYDDYILISSSAIYPDDGEQPFAEASNIGMNKYWGRYGLDKIEAENELMKRNPNAYILRPPYLYGAMNNIYREAFVFDCALNKRKFYLPQDGSMKLQFFNIDDLCRFIDLVIENKPCNHVFNVGNKESITVKEWVEMCYKIADETIEFVEVNHDIQQREYFSFNHYEYYLDVTKQYEIMNCVKPIYDGLKESFDWYRYHFNEVNKKSYIEYIDSNFK